MVASAPTTASVPQQAPAGPSEMTLKCSGDEIVGNFTQRGGAIESRTPEQVVDDFAATLPQFAGTRAIPVRAKIFDLDKLGRQGWAVAHPSDQRRTVAAVFLTDFGGGLMLDGAIVCAP